MEIPPADIIDRIGIVKLKIERIGNLELEKEFEALKKALDEFKKRRIEIKGEWIEELYEINKEEWDLLEEMNWGKKKGEELQENWKVIYSD